MITMNDFIIPMKNPKLKCFKELIELDKNNGYLKAGKRNKNAYLIKSYSNVYYLRIAIDNGNILNINLGNNHRKAMREVVRMLTYYQKRNAIYKVYDHINIIFKKEGENE